MSRRPGSSGSSSFRLWGPSAGWCPQPAVLAACAGRGGGVNACRLTGQILAAGTVTAWHDPALLSRAGVSWPAVRVSAGLGHDALAAVLAAAQQHPSEGQVVIGNPPSVIACTYLASGGISPGRCTGMILPAAHPHRPPFMHQPGRVLAVPGQPAEASSSLGRRPICWPVVPLKAPDDHLVLPGRQRLPALRANHGLGPPLGSLLTCMLSARRRPTMWR